MSKRVSTPFCSLENLLLCFLSGANPNEANKKVHGWTPLHLSTSLEDLVAVSLLLEYGAKPNARALNLQTPMHIACLKRNRELVLFLAARGSSLYSYDTRGVSPLKLLLEAGMKSFIDEVQKAPRISPSPTKHEVSTEEYSRNTEERKEIIGVANASPAEVQHMFRTINVRIERFDMVKPVGEAAVEDIFCSFASVSEGNKASQASARAYHNEVLSEEAPLAPVSS